MPSPRCKAAPSGLTAETQGEVRPCDHVLGAQAYRLAEGCLRLDMAPLATEGDPEIEMVIGVLRGEADGLTEGGLGVRLESLRLEGHAETGLDARIVRPERHRARIRLRFLRPVSLAAAHRGEAEPRRHVAAVEAEGAAEGRGGLGEASERVEGDAGPSMPEPPLGIEARRLAPRHRRLALSPEPPERQPERAVESSQPRPLTDRLAIAGRRFRESPCASQGVG